MENTKTFTLHTYDLQDIVIACIYRSTEDKDPVRRERYEKLTDLFADLNGMVREDNDWTVDITVQG